LKHIQEKPNIK